MRAMRMLVVWGLGAVLAIGAIGPALGADATCAPGTLGVARVAEIDTKGGPWFGTPQGDPEFLRPGEVVLTFDDGPLPKYTQPILAALAAECTKATFFVLGEMAAEFPEMVRETAAAGHTIGTHTWSHPNLKRLSDAAARTEIEATIAAVEQAAKQPIAPFFRFPYLSERAQVVEYLKSRDIAMFAIDIDSFDWRTHDKSRVVRHVMAGLKGRGKGIVLMHDIHASTAAALPTLLAELKANGFKVVHLTPRAAVESLAGFDPPSKAQRTRGHAIRLATRHGRRHVRFDAAPGW